MAGNLARNFAGSFWTHKIKAQIFQGKLRSIFRERIRASKNIFRTNFVLQTCDPKKRTPKEIQHEDLLFDPLSPHSKFLVFAFFSYFKEKNSWNTKNFRG